MPWVVVESKLCSEHPLPSPRSENRDKRPNMNRHWRVI